jgi:acyl carrier protein
VSHAETRALELVRAAIALVLGDDAAKRPDDAPLGADDVDLLEIIMTIEGATGISIPGRDHRADMATPASLARAVAAAMAAGVYVPGFEPTEPQEPSA